MARRLVFGCPDELALTLFPVTVGTLRPRLSLLPLWFPDLVFVFER